MSCTNADFIEFGKGSEWEADHVRGRILRLGWSAKPLTVVKLTATRDVDALRKILASTEDDLWMDPLP